MENFYLVWLKQMEFILNESVCLLNFQLPREEVNTWAVLFRLA